MLGSHLVDGRALVGAVSDRHRLRPFTRRLGRDGENLRDLLRGRPFRGRGAEILLVPCDDPLQPLDAPVGPAAARKVMRLLGESHQLRGLAEQAQRTEQLFGLRHRAAKIHLARGKQQRGAHVLHVADRRAAPQLVEVRPGRRAELEHAPQHDVVLRVLAHEVGDRPHRDRSREAVGLTDDPVGHVTAIRAAADAQPLAVDVAGAFDGLVQRAHEVDVVLARPVAHDVAAKPLAIAVGAAWVHVEDDKAHARQDLELVEEGPSVLGVRAAVDLHHRRVHPALVEVLGLEHPPFEPPAVRRSEELLLRLGDVAVVQPRIQVGDARFGALGQHVELARAARVGGAEGQHSRRQVEVVDPTPPACLLADVAVKVDRPDARHARSAGWEVDAIAFRGPSDSGRVPGAHVVDDAVIHRLVEVSGQAAGAAAGQGHDPKSFQQADVESIRGDERDQVTLGRPDRGAQIEAASKPDPSGVEVDEVEVQLALQVGARLGVAGDHDAAAVRRPVEVGYVPGSVGELLDLAARGRDAKQVVVPAVHVTATVVLVVEAAYDPRDWSAAQLLPTLRWPRIVDHAVSVGEHRPQEGDPLSIR